LKAAMTTGELSLPMPSSSIAATSFLAAARLRMTSGYVLAMIAGHPGRAMPYYR
jgi:hypothetical protein